MVPAALAVHLSIGQAYAWSVFKSPLQSALKITATGSAIPFQVAILVLGLSAAFGGTLVERRGPRWAMSVAAVCFSAGFVISAMGMYSKQYWLVVLGYGVVGGVGLGIGYISPVSTLMKWFPDKPGMATGIAIMGFGGGALIAAPWSTAMLSTFGAKAAGGVGTTFLIHGVVYLAVMSIGVFLVRVPAAGWTPAGWTPPKRHKDVTAGAPRVRAAKAVRTPQFWLLWLTLCLNVTAGIGILETASPMIRAFFASTVTPVSVSVAALFVSLLSIANMSGRFVWSSVSDLVGRKNTYRFYLGAGALTYAGVMLFGSVSIPVFIAGCMLILSFYGGGFSTMPAYLKDLFGTLEVGAIHGRVLTAWSVAGVAGPAIVDALAEHAKAQHKTGPALYTVSFSIMIGLLLAGFVLNELIRPVNPKFHEPLATPSPKPAGLTGDEVAGPVAEVLVDPAGEELAGPAGEAGETVSK